jgi:hypothetical protein
VQSIDANPTKLQNEKSPFQTGAVQRSSDTMVEVVDLAKGRPAVPYSQLVSREFQKLQALHNSCQEDKPFRLPSRDSQLSNVPDTFVEPDFTEDDEHLDESMFREEDELPPLSKVFGVDDEEMNLGVNETYIHVSQNPVQVSSDYGEPFDYAEPQDEPLSYSDLLNENTSLSDESHTFDDDVVDSQARVAATSSGKVSNSECCISDHEASPPGPEAPASSPHQHGKRARSITPELDHPKRRRQELPLKEVDHHDQMDGPQQEQEGIRPAWLEDVDPALLADLEGIVDFV